MYYDRVLCELSIKVPKDLLADLWKLTFLSSTCRKTITLFFSLAQSVYSFPTDDVKFSLLHFYFHKVVFKIDTLFNTAEIQD